MDAEEVSLRPERKSLLPNKDKEFKHFHRDLDGNLEFLSGYLIKKYERLQEMDEKAKLGQTMNGEGQKRLWEDSGSLSTVAWRDYNVFQFHDPNLYDLLIALGDMTREACEYYGLDFKSNRFMVQGWFNVNYSHVGKLDWHIHSHMGAPQFHGYYCVNAEPSETYYDINGSHLIVNNVNNRAILGESKWPHAMADWDWSGPRITVAYDVSPLKTLDKQHEQHYVPLP